mgnify:CR=1 FL=1
MVLIPKYKTPKRNIVIISISRISCTFQVSEIFTIVVEESILMKFKMSSSLFEYFPCAKHHQFPFMCLAAKFDAEQTRTNIQRIFINSPCFHGFLQFLTLVCSGFYLETWLIVT